VKNLNYNISETVDRIVVLYNKIEYD